MIHTPTFNITTIPYQNLIHSYPHLIIIIIPKYYNITKQYNDTIPQSLTKKIHTLHSASVNSLQFGPHEYGLSLACGSSDGKVSILTFIGDTWESSIVNAHSIGVNAVAWAPAIVPASLFAQKVIWFLI
jgi:WD40 repeat protein